MEEDNIIEVGIDAEILEITFDVFVEFLVAAGSKPCEACGHDKWGIGMEDGSDELPAVGKLVSVRKPSSAQWVLETTCRRCGNLRLYNGNRIAKWVQDGKPVIQ